MNLETHIKKLEQEIEALKNRNKRVETNKAWETSLTRTISILILTYFTTTIIFYIIKVKDPYLSALIPTLAFFISMQSLPFIRKIWAKKK